MNKLAKLFKDLPIDDLMLIEKDLRAGNIKKTLEKEIKEKKKKIIHLCPVCSAPVRAGEGIVLEFGKHIRKKAVFDGHDCLEYFLTKIK